MVVVFLQPVLGHWGVTNLKERVWEVGSCSRDQPRDEGAVKVFWMPPPGRREGRRPQSLAGGQEARPSHPGLGGDRAALVESKTAVYSPLETRRTDSIILCFIHTCIYIILHCFFHVVF